MRLITVRLPEPFVAAMDELVRRGVYRSRSEIIRAAVEGLLREERILMKSGLSVDVREIH